MRDSIRVCLDDRFFLSVSTVNRHKYFMQLRSKRSVIVRRYEKKQRHGLYPGKIPISAERCNSTYNQSEITTFTYGIHNFFILKRKLTLLQCLNQCQRWETVFYAKYENSTPANKISNLTMFATFFLKDSKTELLLFSLDSWRMEELIPQAPKSKKQRCAFCCVELG